MPSNPSIPVQIILRRRFATSGPPSFGLDIFESELVSRFKGDPVISSLIEKRMYPLIIPEKPRSSKSGKSRVAFPCLVYALTNTDRVRNLKGPAGIATTEVLFDIRADRYGDVKVIREALRRFDGFRGKLAEDVEILATKFVTQVDAFDWPAGGGTDAGTYTETVGFRFKYREPTFAV